MKVDGGSRGWGKGRRANCWAETPPPPGGRVGDLLGDRSTRSRTEGLPPGLLKGRVLTAGPNLLPPPLSQGGGDLLGPDGRAPPGIAKRRVRISAHGEVKHCAPKGEGGVGRGPPEERLQTVAHYPDPPLNHRGMVGYNPPTPQRWGHEPPLAFYLKKILKFSFSALWLLKNIGGESAVGPVSVPLPDSAPNGFLQQGGEVWH